MDAEAQRRRERLEAMRQAASAEVDRNASPDADKRATALNEPQFRNYTPNVDDTTVPTGRAAAERAVENLIVRPTNLPADTVESAVMGLAERAQAEVPAARPDGTVDVSQLAPQKPNWDLRRDLQKKLDVLEPKTQSALAELIRQRVQADATPDGVDLADAVATQNQLRQAAALAEDDAATE
ncbi:hypothetical protein IWQ60_004954 [Tieghemiomyces parasiticus]|uniref:Coiled-coil domain-containing protein 12 n=1 Tax=Tieghemiomyces parasiticus TaxID=78921 RepID=A0A9W8DV15_9FUNG|nr:hypothetical protein IWQ60_004954 [Tieghemiomyces parasiticus]